MAHNINGTIDQDGGSSTLPLSMQQRKCWSACWRPFPVCSTALCVWLLAVEAAAARSLLSHPSGCSALVPPRALPVFGAGARSRTFVCMRLCRARRDDAVTRCKNCHADAPRIHAARLPFIPAPFTFISRLTRHNKHTHEDTYREDIQRFQWRSPWLQWRSERPTTTTAGSSPRIT